MVDVLDTQVLVDTHGPAADLADPATSELIPLGATALGPATTHPADATVLLHLIHCPRTGSTELQLVSTRLNQAQIRALGEIHQTALALPPDFAEPRVLTRPHENLTMAAWQGPQHGWDLQTPLHRLLQDQARRTLTKSPSRTRTSSWRSATWTIALPESRAGSPGSASVPGRSSQSGLAGTWTCWWPSSRS